MVVPHEEDGKGMLFPDVLNRIGNGLIGPEAGQGPVYEIVDHVYDNQSAVFHKH
jgi:hypothetical protein